MRTRPFSYPHPFPTSFPALGCPSGTRHRYRAELRPGNILWKFGLAFFSKFCFGPGRSTLYHGLPTRRPRGKPKVCCFGCVVLQGFVLEGCGHRTGFFFGGGLSFGSPWHCITLHFFPLLYMILHILCYLIWHYIALLHIAVIPTTHCCCNYFLLIKNIYILCLLVKWLSTLVCAAFGG
jgi:hypothetical protein